MNRMAVIGAKNMVLMAPFERAPQSRRIHAGERLERPGKLDAGVHSVAHRRKGHSAWDHWRHWWKLVTQWQNACRQHISVGAVDVEDGTSLKANHDEVLRDCEAKGCKLVAELLRILVNVVLQLIQVVNQARPWP